MKENTNIILRKGTICKVKETKVMLTEDVVIEEKEDGFMYGKQYEAITR